MRNKIYRRLAFVLLVSLMFSICTPVMAETSETEVVEEHIEESTTNMVAEKNIWKGEVKENNRVYLDENGEKVIGLQKIEDKVYFFDEEGIAQTGWQKVDGVEYYFSKETGERYEECIEEIDGIQYSFNKEGEYSIVEEEVTPQETTPETEESGMETETIPEDASVEEENKIENPIAESVQAGWIETVEGKKYLDTAGNPLKGMQTISGKLYFFDIETGVLQLGWITVGENRYYAAQSGELYRNQIITFGAPWYYMGSDGSVQKGYIKAGNGSLYYGDLKTGILKKSSWVETEEKRYYANEKAELYKNQFIKFGDIYYYMGSDGSVQKGVVQTANGVYYADPESGIIQNLKEGWMEKDGKQYYMSPNGKFYSNQIITFGNIWYYMGSDGSVQKGYTKAADGTLYYGDRETGILKRSGWVEVENKKYYANERGALYKNQIITFGNIWYYMGSDGSVQKGYTKAADGTLYYGNPENGVLKKSGWVEIENKKYYANERGALYKNQIITFGDIWYYMGSDGSVQTGVVNASGTYYYAQDDGVIKKTAGWIEDGNKKYYAAVGGKLYRNQFIKFGDTYYYCGSNAAIVTGKQVVGGVIYNFDSNGIMKKEGGWGEYNGNKYYKNPATGFPYKNQWVTFGQTWYYANANGFMVSGWQTIKGYRYYFYPSTKVMARNTTIDGIRIGADGRAAFYSDRMAVFSTVSTNNANGTYNMKRALSSFNQVIIQPGQTLSFFGVAGPCGQAEGYLPAGVVGGVGYGGGICQASTTLYGAALRAGLTIVERRNHSVPSTYVPIGQDAMVDYGSSDLKIKNNYDFPVKLVTYSYGNTLYVEVWGMQPSWYDYINIESWYTSGNSAVAYRKYIKNGNTVRVEQLPSSFYY